MHIATLARWSPALVAVAGCVAGGGGPPHDLVTAVARAEPERARVPPLDDASLTVDGALDRAAVVAAVLARNPGLDAARDSWRAAVAACRSAVALDDPMVRYALAPLSLGSDARLGQRIEVSQKLPWPGRRRLRGDAAIADAEAAGADLEALRLDLAEATVQAFDDDYIAVRALAINRHHRELLERIETSAIAQYTAGRASPQDPLEAHARILEVDRERLTLETQRRVAVAVLDRLLHRPTGAELPPPPASLAVAPPAGARREHPGRIAAAARVRARRAEAEDAGLAFYPSFELMGSYDTMWDAWQHRWMIGVAIEIPLQRGRRDAEVERARAEQAKATAELASVTDLIEGERARARAEVDESTRVIELHEQQLLPTARQRVDAALAGFTAGQAPLSAVVMAEHDLRDAELAIERARADLDRRAAALDRLEGRLPGGAR